MSFTPNGNNATILTGQLYGRKPTEARASSLGLTRTFSYEPTVEETELRNNNTGADVLVKTRTTTVGANISIVLDEFTARNLAMKLLANAEGLTQAAESGLLIAEADIVPGQITKLAGKRATNVSLQDDAMNDLIAGTHYTLNAKTGYITWLEAAPAVVSGTYDLAEITASDNMTTLDLLKRTQGTEIILTCIPTNDGPQALVEEVLVSLTPAGATDFIAQDSEFQTIELEGKALFNANNPEHPFGIATHISG